VHESIILLLPTPACIARTIAMLLHVYCAIYEAPPTHHLYAMHTTILAMAISCKGQRSWLVRSELLATQDAWADARSEVARLEERLGATEARANHAAHAAMGEKATFKDHIRTMELRLDTMSRERGEARDAAASTTKQLAALAGEQKTLLERAERLKLEGVEAAAARAAGAERCATIYIYISCSRCLCYALYIQIYTYTYV